MKSISSNYFEFFILLRLQHVASLDNVCHHGDEHCEESSPDNKYTMETNSGIPADKPKKILYWTHFYGHRDFEFGYGQKPFIEAGCPVSNCIATDNKDEVDDADALLFHLRNVNQETEFPKRRKPNQRYVFFLLEHPYHQWNDLRNFESIFNLTMTYRRDSDVPLLYGKVIPRDPREPWQPKNLEKPRKLVAWFVGNCDTKSKRELYVKELQKYIDVDIYGKCGPLKCPDNPKVYDPRMNKECYDMLEQNYKFYLSFENIFCKDYVTEKLVFNILPLQVVPVVMGGTDYARDAPPGSIINIEDFKSPKHLADYLKELDNDDVAYNEYFKWKHKYKIVSVKESFKEGFCKLCEVLNDPNFEKKTYTDIDAWWGKHEFCYINKHRSILKT